jgi:membrane-associated phospholipid phosphatase
MSNMRDLWYDWLGLNTWLFKQINSLSGDTVYDTVMKILTMFGDKKLLPYFLAAIATFAFVSLIIRIVTKKGGNRNYFLLWVNIFMVLGAGLLANKFVIDNIKNHFMYPRPYVALPAKEVKQLEFQPAEDARHSFPSGHTAIITILVLSLWPILNENFRWLGIGLISGVAWSRMALGVHYPMDVLTGFTLALIIMLLIRAVLNEILGRFFGWKC